MFVSVCVCVCFAVAPSKGGKRGPTRREGCRMEEAGGVTIAEGPLVVRGVRPKQGGAGRAIWCSALGLIYGANHILLYSDFCMPE